MRHFDSPQRQVVGSASPSALAFATLLLAALLMGANHVAARAAFDDGADVFTAVAFRSLCTAVVVAALVALNRVPWRVAPKHQRALGWIGVLVVIQSFCLYSAVSRLPVALALLAFNLYPLCAALWARLLYGARPPAKVLVAIPILLFGLGLALDVVGAASGLGVAAQWGQMGVGVAFAVVAAVLFGLVLVLTQHETVGVDGRVRTAAVMALVGVIATACMVASGGPHWPKSETGWWGLGLLSLLYGSGLTLMFTVLPRLGVVGSSPVLNVEPVFALALAWAFLGQAVAPVQVLGCAVVVATVMWLGLRPVASLTQGPPTKTGA